MLDSAEQPESLYQLIFETKNPNQGFPDDVPLLIDAENTERYYTFNELRTKVRAFAQAILGPSFGLQQGDVVAICSRNDVSIMHFIVSIIPSTNRLVYRLSTILLSMELWLQV